MICSNAKWITLQLHLIHTWLTTGEIFWKDFKNIFFINYKSHVEVQKVRLPVKLCIGPMQEYSRQCCLTIKENCL